MKYRKVEKVAKNPYPSDCGSHASMVNEEYIEFNSASHPYVICKDQRGDYVTFKDRLDNGLCDYDRTSHIGVRESKLKSILERINV